MTRYRKLAALSVASSLVFVGAACSGDDVADNLTERAIEQSSGGDVDIDSEDGKVTYTDEDGNQSEIDVSGNAELPDGFPEELAPPDNVSIITASTNTLDGQVSMFVSGEGEGTVEQFFEGIKTQLTDAGYEITSESSTSTADGGFASIGATGDYEVSVAISGDGSGTSSINFTVTEPATD